MSYTLFREFMFFKDKVLTKPEADMKRPVLLPHAIIFLIVNAGPVFAGQTTLTTTYPAPNGQYQKLTVTDSVTLQNNAAASGNCPNGPQQLTLANFNGELRTCNGNPATVWSTINPWVQTSSVPPLIYPANNAALVGIGNNDPQYALDLGNATGKKLAVFNGGGVFAGLGYSANTLEVYAQNSVSPQMVIKNNGWVGINNVTGPSAALDAGSGDAKFGKWCEPSPGSRCISFAELCVAVGAGVCR